MSSSLTVLITGLHALTFAHLCRFYYSFSFLLSSTFFSILFIYVIRSSPINFSFRIHLRYCFSPTLLYIPCWNTCASDQPLLYMVFSLLIPTFFLLFYITTLLLLYRITRVPYNNFYYLMATSVFRLFLHFQATITPFYSVFTRFLTDTYCQCYCFLVCITVSFSYNLSPLL